MTRWISAAALAAVVFGAPSAYAQSPKASRPQVAFPSGSIEGRVLDDALRPVAGAMVSVVGRTTAAATTDRDGRYALHELPFGPYVLSVHSRGYFKSRGRTIQLTTGTVAVPEIQIARARKTPPVTAPPTAEVPAVPTPTTQLAAFGAPTADVRTVLPIAETADAEEPEPEIIENGETAWRLRHLPRSILKTVTTEGVWDNDLDAARWLARHSTVVPVAFFAELPLSGQVNLMTIDSFDRAGELFEANAPRSVAYVSVNTRAAGGAWAMQGAMTQGDLSSWILAGSYKSIESANHAYELGMSYSTQRYDGGNAAALSAIPDSARNVGRIYGFDEWTVSPRLIVGYGTGYARYDYLGGPGVWSPRVSVTVPMNGFRVKAMASRKALVPGAEEFAPSVTGMWLPPERTFSSLSPDGRFMAEQVRHAQLSLERDLAAGVTVAIRGFDQRIQDQLIEIFDASPGRAQPARGHYYVANGGDIDARGWGVSMTQEVPGIVRGALEYTVSTAYWDTASDISMARAVRAIPVDLSEKVHDLQTWVEMTIPQTATRVYAKYRVNTAFWSGDPDAYLRASSNSRFNVRVNQSLPFLRFSNADWEALIDIRNIFREMEVDSSVYDEAFAIRAPKRIVGGLQVRF
jgi:hypothetical protein